jgi:hypothetical protein
MSRTLANDHLAAKARERAEQAKPDSRERLTWNIVASALESTGTVQGARAFLFGLSIPTLRTDALRFLYKLSMEN